jgi:hypothetical protein
LKNVVVMVALCLSACHARDSEFFARIYSCEPGARGDQCGPTQDGKPMVCFNGQQIGGGRSFCTEACDPAVAPEEPGTVCLSSGALLRSCRPVEGETDPSYACPPDLSCFRTNALVDEGVCVDAQVCTEDEECTGTMRTTCAARLLRERVPASVPAMADHLACVQATCSTSGMDCPSGESCLGKYYVIAPDIPDICVPNCDSNLQCPPGFACGRDSYARAAPALCLPGVPGARCTTQQDCLLGACFDTGVGFSLCTVLCRTNDDCAVLDGPGATYLCLPDAHRCVNALLFQGPACTTADDCAPGLDCYDYSPFAAFQLHGECRLPCDEDHHCPARGGVPHVCLAEGAGGCYPGSFGLPCSDSSECWPQLSCQAVSEDTRYAAGTTICTVPCLADADCDAVAATTNGGFCQDGFCHLGGNVGTSCQRDAQCLSDRCATTGPGPGTCIDPETPL